MDERIRTTVSVPRNLLEAADRAVREGRSRSRSEFVAEALRREVARRERERIDADFAGMGQDAAYLDESERIAEDFSEADREALEG